MNKKQRKKERWNIITTGWPSYKYMGGMKYGKPHGQGSKIYSSGEEEVGEFYEGEFLKGKTIKIYLNFYREDKHLLDAKNENMKKNKVQWGEEESYEDTKGNIVVGKFWDQKEPLLIDTWGNELKLYVGEIVNGKRHGKGKLKIYIPDEEKSFLVESYDGEWKDGKKHSFGIQKVYRHLEYQGNWREDKYHGEGKLIQYWNGKEYHTPGEEICLVQEGMWHNNECIDEKTFKNKKGK